MGYKQGKNVPPMERELKYLLADLCVIWGFCIPSEDIEEISTAEYYYADNFAKDVVESDGMNPESEIKWVKRIAKRFTERFGSDEIDVSTFVDRVRDVKENWNTY